MEGDKSMPIIGFNFDKLYVEKMKPIEPPLNINTNVAIKDVTEEKTALSGKDDKVLRFNFEFGLEYDPKLADLKIAGHIHYLEKKKEADKLVADWKKSKKLEGDTGKAIINTILLKCNIKALQISQDVNLPPHLRLPIVQAKPRKK
jgi:hypothetical protein